MTDTNKERAAAHPQAVLALLDRIADLEAQLESIGAGGVHGPLIGCASPPTAQPEGGAQLNPDMPVQELRLHMGELTTDEVLVARASIRWANSQKEARVPLSDAEALAIVRSVPALFTAEEEWLYCIREVEHHYGITAAQKEPK